MRILVFSDSHRDFLNMRSVIDKLNGGLDLVLHLGDHYSDAEALKYAYPDLKLHSVRGNGDYAPEAPNDMILELSGYKIFITHGHLYNVKSTYNSIIAAAEARNADICLFGHTHIPDIFYAGKTLFLNPGSISNVRSIEKPTYGILNFENDKVEPSVTARANDGYRPVKINPRRLKNEQER